MKFSSVTFRLKSMVILAIVASLFLGMQSISGMNNVSTAVEGLFSQGGGYSTQLGGIVTSLEKARGETLLAFQHNPANKFATMHDHSISAHLDEVTQRLDEIEHILKDQISMDLLSPEQQRLAVQLIEQFDTLRSLGYSVTIQEIDKGNFDNANLNFLRVINPAIVRIEELVYGLLRYEQSQTEVIYQEVSDSMSEFVIQMAVILAFSSSVLGVFAYVIVRRLNLALETIHVAAEKVSDGDLTQRVKLDGNDELSILSGHVDEIVTRFQNVIVNMNECTFALSASSEKGSEIAVRTRENVMEQQQQTQMVATAINEFTSTVQEVSSNASAASAASEEAEKVTVEGKSVVGNTVAMINDLNTEIRESTNIIQQLSQKSNDIGGVLDVIQGISEQTNLLALNAAIEAARAGEAGRGFAVVADEVRSLASRTQGSTEEIKSMIFALQESSQESLNRMRQGAKLAEMTAEMADEAGLALEKIASRVDVINSMNTQIAAAAEQQNIVTDEINRNVHQINDISSETARGSEENNSAAQELRELTENIKGDISRYRYC